MYFINFLNPNYISISRKAIPLSLKREVFIESGHRCAILRCKQVPVELAHIVQWSECKEHTFDNLIALCPTCHTRFDKGEISKKEMQIYKSNLSIINNRYGDLEQRVLKILAEEDSLDSIWLPGGLDILLMYLLNDGLLVDTGEDCGISIGGIPAHKSYKITEKGKVFIKKWVSMEELK